MTEEQTMSPLRARMIEDMKLAGLAATTQAIHLQAVRSLAKLPRAFRSRTSSRYRRTSSSANSSGDLL